MLVSEESLARAIRTFLLESKIPRPDGWTVFFDDTKIRHCIIPAFLEALGELGSVDFCVGFSEEKAFELFRDMK